MSLTSLTAERKQLQEENQEFIKQKAQMEFLVKDLEQSVSEDDVNKVRD